MNIDYTLDQDGCINAELIANSVDWHKEKGGDNILLQYVNGGENMRIVERFSEDVDIAEVHHWGKSFAIMFSNGDKKSYYQDKYGNYKTLKEHKDMENHNRQKEEITKSQNYDKSIKNVLYTKMNKREY